MVALLVMLAATGCTGAVPLATPTESLQAAMARNRAESHRYALSYGSLVYVAGERAIATDAGGGASVAESREVAIERLGFDLEASALLFVGDAYIKTDSGLFGVVATITLQGKWLQVDPTRLEPGGLLAFLFHLDSTAVDSLLRGVVDVHYPSEGNQSGGDQRVIAGTIDLRQSGLPMATPGNLSKLSEDDRIVPFQVTLDIDGRITRLALQLPKLGRAPAAELSVTFFDYGAAIEIPRPGASEVEPLADAFYPLLDLSPLSA